MLIYAPDHFGRHGFKRPPETRQRLRALNVGELDRFVPALEAAGALQRDGATYIADLAKAGVDRLLGGGRSHRSWRVYVGYATRNAKEKVTVLDAPPGADEAPTSEEPAPAP